MAMLAGYPSLRYEGPPRRPAPACSRPHQRYAHRTRVPQWHAGGMHCYPENTLERKNFQASAFRVPLKNRASILSPHEQLLSRIDRYQLDEGFRMEMQERYRRLMKRVDHPFDPPAPRTPTPGGRASSPNLMRASASAGGLPTAAAVAEEPKKPSYRSAETQTGPDLDRVTIKRPSSAKLSRSASAGALPRRPRSANPMFRDQSNATLRIPLDQMR